MVVAQRWLAFVALTLSVALSTTVAQASSAGAFPFPRIYAASADHHAAYDIFKEYRREGVAVPLRWGTKRFGYRHIRHRWNPTLDAGIAATLTAGHAVGVSGTAQTYEYWQRDPTGKFPTGFGWRVVVQWATTRHDGKPKGIITAYEIART